jgi:hypothetical protein
MTRSITVHPSSFAIGVAFAAICILAMSQASPPSDTWPPPKRSILNVDAETPVTIAPNGFAVVYTVPNDRWLTITEAAASIDDHFGNGFSTIWTEELNGVSTQKGRVGIDTSGPIGWTFRPGSSVVVTAAQPVTTYLESYSLLGYLSYQ